MTTTYNFPFQDVHGEEGGDSYEDDHEDVDDEEEEENVAGTRTDQERVGSRQSFNSKR